MPGKCVLIRKVSRPVGSVARASVGLRALLGSRRLLVLLAGTAGCWFLLDYAYYGNTISTPQIIARRGRAGRARCCWR